MGSHKRDIRNYKDICFLIQDLIIAAHDDNDFKDDSGIAFRHDITDRPGCLGKGF